MAGEAEMGTRTTVVRSVVPKSRRERVIIGVVVVAVLVGGGLRFVPASGAADTAGQETPASTACAAQ
jgi:hypothetical protein